MKHPQHDNLIIAANDGDALFECKELPDESYSIHKVLSATHFDWKHVKPPYKYQHVKDAWEKDKSLVVQCKNNNYDWTNVINPPLWIESMEYQIKPKTITKRLYADLADGRVRFLSCPDRFHTFPINGTDTEVECEQ